MAGNNKLFIALAALAVVALVASAAPLDDEPEFEIFRVRRTPQRGGAVMRGYVGYQRRGGYPMAVAAGSYASRTRHAPAYYTEPEAEEEPQPEPQPVEASAEEEQQDPAQEEEPQEEEEEAPAPAPVAPVRPSRARPSRPANKPQRPASKPQQPAEESDDFPPMYGSGKRPGATAIATSYSRGDGAVANSHAIAYDGTFTGGVFRHRYQKNN